MLPPSDWPRCRISPTRSPSRDCAWPQWGQASGYFSEPVICYRWASDPTTFAFDIDVEANTPTDYYDLVFAVAGKLADGGGLFYAEEHFYLQVITLPGVEQAEASGAAPSGNHAPQPGHGSGAVQRPKTSDRSHGAENAGPEEATPFTPDLAADGT